MIEKLDTTIPLKESGFFFKQNLPIKYFPTTYDKIINKYALLYNIEPNIIKRIIRIESNFNPKVKGYRVKEGDTEYGLMQVYAHYAAKDGFNANKIKSFDIDENIHAGVYHLRSFYNLIRPVLEKLGFSNKQILNLTVASYNAGAQAIIDRANKYKTYNGIWNSLPYKRQPNGYDTRNYVRKYNQYGQLSLSVPSAFLISGGIYIYLKKKNKI